VSATEHARHITRATWWHFELHDVPGLASYRDRLHRLADIALATNSEMAARLRRRARLPLRQLVSIRISRLLHVMIAYWLIAGAAASCSLFGPLLPRTHDGAYGGAEDDSRYARWSAVATANLCAFSHAAKALIVALALSTTTMLRMNSELP